MRGEVDHEWHIYFDDTKPASLYGGTWEELAQGTFIMAAGSDGTAGQTGGSNTVSLTEENNGPHSHSVYVRAGEEVGGQSTSVGAYASLRVSAEKPGVTWQAYTGGVTAGYTSDSGSGTPFSIVPTNISAHIWKRVS